MSNLRYSYRTLVAIGLVVAFAIGLGTGISLGATNATGNRADAYVTALAASARDPRIVAVPKPHVVHSRPAATKRSTTTTHRTTSRHYSTTHHAGDPTAAQLAKLRWCESGRDGTWAVNAKSNARGYYQFLPSTWRSVGGTGDPAAASLAEQTYRAILLYHREGWRPWLASSGCTGLY